MAKCFTSFEVINVDCDSLVGLFLGLLYLGVCEGKRSLYDELNHLTHPLNEPS